MELGVIYSATGYRNYIQYAIEAARQTRRIMPHLPITLFCSEPIEEDCFDQVILLDKNDWPALDETRLRSRFRPFVGDKITAMQRSPYAKTLFLDSDTYVCEDVSELFQLLDRFDIAVAHDAKYGRDYYDSFNQPYEVADVPFCYPEYNTGVMLFKQSERVSKLFDDWYDRYWNHWVYKAHDQQPFREAVYRNSDVSLVTLPPTYNVHIEYVCGYLYGPVKIMHGKHVQLEKVEKQFNRNHQLRVWIKTYSGYKMLTEQGYIPYRIRQVRESIQRRGLLPTLRSLSKRVWYRVTHLHA